MKKLFSILLFVAVVVVGGSAQAQQPRKVPLIGYLWNSNAATESIRAEGIQLTCASLATLKDRTSSSSTDMRRGADRAPEAFGGLVRQSEDRETDRSDNSAECASAGEQSH